MRSTALSLLLATLLVTCCVAYTAEPSFLEDEAKNKAPFGGPWAEFIGQDLSRLSEQSQDKTVQAARMQMKTRLDELIGKTLPPMYTKKRCENWRVWRAASPAGEERCILFQRMQMLMIPGESEAAVHFFDAAGTRLKSMDFPTGWRIVVQDAKLRKEPLVDGFVIEVTSTPVIKGPDISKQVFGVLDRRIALVRLEDSQGNPIVNNYHAPNYTIGPEVPDRTIEAWEQVLESAGKIEVLEALTWLGGNHSKNLGPVDPMSGIESRKDAVRVARVRGSTKVQRSVDQLTQSDNPWIKSAAQAAQKEIKGK